MRILDTTVYEIAGQKRGYIARLGGTEESGVRLSANTSSPRSKISLPPTTKATGNTTAIAGPLKKASVIAARLTSPSPHLRA
jgi:hypothetical protein